MNTGVGKERGMDEENIWRVHGYSNAVLGSLFPVSSLLWCRIAEHLVFSAAHHRRGSDPRSGVRGVMHYLG